MALCDRQFPSALAFKYLDELQKEFQDKYGQEVHAVARPYAFVKFGKIETISKSLDGADNGKVCGADLQNYRLQRLIPSLGPSIIVHLQDCITTY